MSERKNRWVLCKGCNKPLGLFPQGIPPHLPKNAVGHVKPKANFGKPNSVPCTLYSSLTAEELINFHDDSPDIENPSEFKPFSN